MTTFTEAAPGAEVPETLGPFDHHPDSSIDFCCEVDTLTGYAYDVRVGANFSDDWRAASQWGFWGRVSRALHFVRVRGDQIDEGARAAIPLLRSLENYALGKDNMPVTALPALAQSAASGV